MENKNKSNEKDHNSANDRVKVQTNRQSHSKDISNNAAQKEQKYKQIQQADHKALEAFHLDQSSIINQKQIIKPDLFPTSTQARYYSQKLPQFSSTQNSMINIMKKENQQKGIGEHEDNYDYDKEKGSKRNSSMLGLSALTTAQDGDFNQNQYQSMRTNHKMNISSINISDNPDIYRIQFFKDSPKELNSTPSQQKNQLQQAVRSPLQRKFTLSVLNKEEKMQGKKVFYSLKNAIRKDSRQKLQQLTINQQALISDDIKQNFIPKMLKMDHSSPFKVKIAQKNGSTLPQHTHSQKKYRTEHEQQQQQHQEEQSDHQSKLLLSMQQKNQKSRFKSVQIHPTSDRNQSIALTNPSQEPSKTNLKESSLHNSQTNIQTQAPFLLKGLSQHHEKQQPNTISNTFKKMAFIYQNDIHAQNNGIDQKLLMIIKILDSRSKVMKDLKCFNLDNTILQLLEIIKFSIEYDDIDLMMDVMIAIGDIYIMFGDLQSAINTFNSIRVLSDFTQDYKVKIECYMHLSSISKKIKQYHHALRFIKKALQYIWEINDVDREIHIYEEIGLVFFHMYNLEKATQFHQRAINGGVEFKESNQRQQASKNLHYYLANLENKIQSIDKYTLLKIPMLPFKFIPLDDNETMPLHIQNPYMKKNRMKLVFDSKGFKSDLHELHQIDLIFQSEEFFIEVQTPRNDSQLNRFASSDDDIILSNIEEIEPDVNKKKNRFANSRSGSNTNVNQFRTSAGQKFIPPKHLMKRSEQNTTFYLNESLKKKTLEEKIKDRVEELKLWEKRDHLGKLMNNPFKKGGSAQINQIIQINHLGVNRNIDNFDHSQNIQVSKPNIFFNKIISTQYQKNMNLNI